MAGAPGGGSGGIFSLLYGRLFAALPASPGFRTPVRRLSLQDKTLKCTVYRVRGSVSASNYIQLPKTSTQSLGLTGRYLYVLFRPLPTKHFVIHLDVSTEVLSWERGAARGPALLRQPGPLISMLCPTGQPGHPSVFLQSLQGVQVHSYVASVPLHL